MWLYLLCLYCCFLNRIVLHVKFGLFHRCLFYSRLENGPDPALNIKLEHLIERAKATNMAKDKIESAIKSGVKVDFCKLSRTNVGMQCR